MTKIMCSCREFDEIMYCKREIDKIMYNEWGWQLIPSLGFIFHTMIRDSQTYTNADVDGEAKGIEKNNV